MQQFVTNNTIKLSDYNARLKFTPYEKSQVRIIVNTYIDTM